MIAQAVIGASYGDEGKGRTVDWLAAPLGTAALVVRTNGGAQAGHTVLAADGRQHVFHHVGAGTLRGARTHLSRYMVSHPILLADEAAALGRLGIQPAISADPRGWVTTPWDMMINQAVEVARAGARHGSCGLGFGETIERCEVAGFPLTVADLFDTRRRDKLMTIRAGWFARRRTELALADDGPLEYADAPTLFERFVSQCEAFAASVALRDDAALGDEPALIFEAAQGLLLDQRAPGYPYLTRSNTGLANIAAITREAGIAALSPVYVTRPYLTRHGRGPMEDERAIEAWFAVDDPTNRPNTWQETLRFGLLDPAALAARIAADLAGVTGLTLDPSLVVTCLDQATGELPWLSDGRLQTMSRNAFLDHLSGATDLPVAAHFTSPSNFT